MIVVARTMMLYFPFEGDEEMRPLSTIITKIRMKTQRYFIAEQTNPMTNIELMIGKKK